MRVDEFVAWLATATSSLLLMSPLSVLPPKNFQGPIPEMVPWAVMWTNCVFWIIYGVMISSPAVSVCNFWGLCTTTYSLYCLWKLTSERAGGPIVGSQKRVAALCTSSLAICVFAFVLWFFGGSPFMEASVTGLGMMSCGAAVATFAAPLASVSKILKLRSTEGLLSPMMAVLGLIAGVLWTTSGIMKSDAFIIAPNVLTTAMSFAMLGLIIRFRPRRGESAADPCKQPSAVEVASHAVDVKPRIAGDLKAPCSNPVAQAVAVAVATSTPSCPFAEGPTPPPRSPADPPPPAPTTVGGFPPLRCQMPLEVDGFTPLVDPAGVWRGGPGGVAVACAS